MLDNNLAVATVELCLDNSAVATVELQNCENQIIQKIKQYKKEERI